MIEQLLKQSESKTLVPFANAACGRLVIDVDDAPRHPSDSTRPESRLAAKVVLLRAEQVGGKAQPWQGNWSSHGFG